MERQNSNNPNPNPNHPNQDMDKSPIGLRYSQNDIQDREESLVSSLEHFQNLPQPQKSAEETWSMVVKKRAKKGEYIQNRDQNFINDPFAINSRPSPSATSKGKKRVRHGSGPSTNVKQKCAKPKPKPDTCPNAQAATDATSQHQTQSEQKYVVCDTNTWMSSLRVITAILHDHQMVNYNIYVPYRVGEELDNLKTDDDPETSANARKAGIAKNDFKKAYPTRLIQQTDLQNRTAKFKHYSYTNKADHEIIAACLKLRAEGKDVEMCTNDRNLETEAMANEIPIHPPITPKMRRKIIEKCRNICMALETRNKAKDDELFNNLLTHSYLYVNASQAQREKATKILQGEET